MEAFFPLLDSLYPDNPVYRVAMVFPGAGKPAGNWCIISLFVEPINRVFNTPYQAVEILGSDHRTLHRARRAYCPFSPNGTETHC